MSVPVVAGGRTSQQFVRYLAQQVAKSGSVATDYNRLSVLRTIAELNALLGERFEEELAVVAAEAIDTAAYRSFGFVALPATKAYGNVTFTRTFYGNDLLNSTAIAALTIPANTIIRVPGTTKQFTNYKAATFPAFTQNGATPTQTLTVTVVADGPGATWNTNAGTITEIVTPLPGQGVVTVSNASDIKTGTDDEDDESRRLRFSAYIQGIHRATADAIEYGVKKDAYLQDDFGVITELIQSAQCVDTQVAGTANLYIWNGTAAAPPAVSPTLKALAQKVVNGYVDSNGVRHAGYKAAGAKVSVLEATILAANVSVAVYPTPGMSLDMVSEAVRLAILRVFARMSVGDAALKMSDLRYAVGTVRGVIDHAFSLPETISSPTIAPSISAVAVPGGAADPTVAPTLGTTSTTSTLASGSWTVGYTYYNAHGESGLSPTATVSLGTSNNLGITVTSLTLPANVTGVRYYLKQPGGGIFGFSKSFANGNSQTLTIAPVNTTNPPSTSGAATGGTTTTITASSPNWTTNMWAGYTVFIKSGTGVGQVATVASNTATTLTFSAMAVAPDNTSTFILYQGVPNSTGTPVAGATFLPPGKYTASYTWANAGGQTIPSSASDVVVITAGKAISTTIPGSILNPVLAPTVSSPVDGGSTLAAGSYLVAYTYYNAAGETVISPTTSISVSSGHSLVIEAINVPTTATGVRYYLEAPSSLVYGLGGTNTNGAQITILAPPNNASNPPSVNTTGTMPAGATGIKWYISASPGSQTRAYVSTSTSGAVTLPVLPTDATLTEPTGNTTGNVGGGDGVIIVPGTITITQGV